MARVIALVATLICLSSLSLAQAPVASPGHPGWIRSTRGCLVWNPSPVMGETVSWNGSCVNGHADGKGLVIWRGMEGGVDQSVFVTMQGGRVVAEGPSFDCNRATSAVERMICSSRELSSLDRELDGKVRQVTGVCYDLKPSVTRDQRRWIHSRDQCQSEQCVAASYKARLAQIYPYMSCRIPNCTGGVSICTAHLW